VFSGINGQVIFDKNLTPPLLGELHEVPIFNESCALDLDFDPTGEILPDFQKRMQVTAF